jgi:hypothetical protein
MPDQIACMAAKTAEITGSCGSAALQRGRDQTEHRDVGAGRQLVCLNGRQDGRHHSRSDCTQNGRERVALDHD